MRNTLIAATFAGITAAFTAQAQECIEMSDLQAQWQEQNITTNMVFAGQGDNGILTYIFENPDNARWSEWMAEPTNPTCVQLFDQGSQSSSDHMGFTTKSAPESSL